MIMGRFDMEDYPKNFWEFVTRFQREEDCIDYIIKLRWPNGFICPVCRGSKAWKTSRNLIHCVQCGHQTSITAGTLFHNTRKPLRLWFHVMWWVMSQKTGASAYNLKDFMGFGSYETAWAWLHKLRRAMIRTGRDRLVGEVEVDDTYIGGKEIGTRKKGRGAETKTLVVVGTECKGKQIGRVRFSCISEASNENLLQFIEENID